MNRNKIYMLVGALILIGVTAWLYDGVTEWIERDKIKDDKITLLRDQWAQLTKERAAYRNERSEVRDSVMMLLVQKGQVEIELNRTKAQLQQANASYKQSRQDKDTTKALTICDSIVFTFVPGYLELDSSQQGYIDTLQLVSNQWEVKQNDIVEAGFNKADSTVKVEIKAAENKPKKERRHRRGEDLKIGGIGAAIGVLLTLIFGG